MGSYISIVNDTQDPWQCKIGPDMAALKIAGLAVGSVGALGTVIASAGSTAPLFAGVSTNGIVSVFGVSSSALATVPAGAASLASTAAVVGDVSGFGMAVAKNLADQLNKNGYHVIAPGGRHGWGESALPVAARHWVKTVIVSETKVRVEALYLRPIFTGATANSNRDYMVKHWLEKEEFPRGQRSGQGHIPHTTQYVI